MSKIQNGFDFLIFSFWICLGFGVQDMEFRTSIVLNLATIDKEEILWKFCGC
jgi:hypothetical protein